MNFRTYKLKDIGEVITGNTPSKSNSEFYDSKDVMFIKPDDLYIDRITMLNESKEYLSNKGAEHARILPQGSVLVTCIGIIGKVGILKQEMAAFNQQLNAIVPNKNIVNEKYLAYKIWNDRKKLQLIANAPVVPIINKRQFSDFQIEIPPIDYQLKVVDVLDKAQELIDKRKAQIEALDQLTQSVFLEMFGDPINTKWKTEKLSEITDVRDGTHDSPKYIQKGYPLVTSKNIKDGEIDLTNVNYISEEDYEKINQRSKVDIGDIIMPMIGTIGNPVIVNVEPNFAIKNVALIKFYPDTCIINIYLKYLLDSHYLDFVLSKNRRGGTQKFLSLKNIRNMEIPVPPIKLQKDFTKVIREINEKKKLLNKSLDEMVNAYNSIMQRAFKGELFTEDKVPNH